MAFLRNKGKLCVAVFQDGHIDMYDAKLVWAVCPILSDCDRHGFWWFFFWGGMMQKNFKAYD